MSWLLARAGPVGTAGFGALAGCPDQTVRSRGGFFEASTDLFPSLDVVIAYRLLFGVYSGIVPDGIDDLATGDIDWAGDATILLSFVKGRTAAESLNLPRRAVRLLEQWLAHTALLRSFAGPDARRQLWLGTSRPAGTALATGTIDRTVIQRWVLRHGVIGDDGRPLKIHRSRIRTTHQSMRDKSSWAGRGRATVDPNHSPQVEGDNYLTANAPSESIRAISGSQRAFCSSEPHIAIDVMARPASTPRTTPRLPAPRCSSMVTSAAQAQVLRVVAMPGWCP